VNGDFVEIVVIVLFVECKSPHPNARTFALMDETLQ